MRTGASSRRWSRSPTAASRSIWSRSRTSSTASGELDEVGGPAYISALTDGVPRSANVEYYAQDRQGEVDAAAADPVGERRARRAPTTPRRTPTTCSTKPSGRSSRSPSTGCAPGFVRVSELVDSGYQLIEQLQQHKGLVTGVPSGFVDLDEMTSGFQKSDLVIVAARPSMGKTSFVLNIALHCGIEAGKTVGIFSLEMSKEQLFLRMLTSEARVDAHRFRGGFLGEQDYARLVEAFARLHDAKVFIDDTPSVGILEMRAKARRLKLEHGLDMLVIDYLQLMQGRGRFDNRQQELASISRSLKILAKELEDADPRAQPAQPRARDPRRSSAAALRPARVGRARAGRRRRAVHLPRGDVPVEGRAQRRSPKASPRSSSASSATARPARCGSRSSSSTRGSRISPPAAATGDCAARAAALISAGRVADRDQPTTPRSTSTRSRPISRATSAARPTPNAGLGPASHAAVIAVVKANAYGHGATAVGARARGGRRVDARLRRHRGRRRRCATPASTVPILVFGALSVSDLDGVFDAST